MVFPSPASNYGFLSFSSSKNFQLDWPNDIIENKKTRLPLGCFDLFWEKSSKTRHLWSFETLSPKNICWARHGLSPEAGATLFRGLRRGPLHGMEQSLVGKKTSGWGGGRLGVFFLFLYIFQIFFLLICWLFSRDWSGRSAVMVLGR